MSERLREIAQTVKNMGERLEKVDDAAKLRKAQVKEETIIIDINSSFYKGYKEKCELMKGMTWEERAEAVRASIQDTFDAFTQMTLINNKMDKMISKFKLEE